MVDAVWSEDGDALALGCRTLIKSFYKVRSSTAAGERRDKSTTQFRVYKVDDLEGEYPGMNREGFILHAVFNRASIDSRQGPCLRVDDLLEAARLGLGKSLCATRSPKELQVWAKTELSAFLKDIDQPEVSNDFPKWHHLQQYIAPIVSRSEILSNFPIPPEPFEHEEELYSFLTKNLQFTSSQWVTYVLPYRIVRSLIPTKEGAESQHDYLKITCEDLKPKRNSKSLSSKKLPKSAVAEFVPHAATSINIASLFMETTRLETMTWILRKSNYNQQPSIVSLWSPQSNQKGKVGLSSSAAKRQRLVPAGESTAAATSNGEGPSGTNANRENANRLERQDTPPSPTPTPAPASTRSKRSRDTAMKGAKRAFKVSKVTRGPAPTKDVTKDQRKEPSSSPNSTSTRSQTLEHEPNARNGAPSSTSTRSQTLEHTVIVDHGCGINERAAISPAPTSTLVGDDNEYVMIDSD